MNNGKEPSKNLFNPQGFTLIELAFVLVIFPTLMISIFSVLDMANVIFHTNDVYSRLNQSAMQTLRSISREIGQTNPNPTPPHLNITRDAGNNSIVAFQIPVDWDNDGDVITAGVNPNVEWGAYDEVGRFQSGRLNGWTRYSVVSSQLIREVIQALDAGQNPVMRRVIANNVQNFNAVQTQNILSMTLTLSGTDTIGQAGRQRTIQTTFASDTVLRNAVN